MNYIKSIGGEAIITSKSHTRATTRIAEAFEKIEKHSKERFDVVVMVQGDEPTIKPETIEKAIRSFNDPENNIVNIMSQLSSKETFEDRNNVKVVVDNNNNALYFSREPIPSSWKGWENLPRYMQTGIIAFRRDALISFNALDETQLEQIESVDMNRVLETGGKIRMVLTDEVTIGVDVQEELEAASEMLTNDPVMKSYISS